MTDVNGAEWLQAIDDHSWTIDTDLVVAAAMLNDGSIGLDRIEGKSDEDVQDAVEELISHGFLESMFSVDWSPEHTEHSLRLRLPFGHTDLSGYTWPAELRTPGADR